MNKKLKKFDPRIVFDIPIVTNMTDNFGKLKGKKVTMNTTITIEHEKANGMHKKMNNNKKNESLGIIWKCICHGMIWPHENITL